MYNLVTLLIFLSGKSLHYDRILVFVFPFGSSFVLLRVPEQNPCVSVFEQGFWCASHLALILCQRIIANQCATFGSSAKASNIGSAAKRYALLSSVYKA